MRILLLPLLLLALSASAEPFKPVSDSFVVERLPKSLLRLQKSRRAGPLSATNIVQATSLAREYLQIAQATSDAAFVRYAKQTLEPWRGEPSPDLLFLKAVIGQHEHAFDLALADLEVVLRTQPAHVDGALLKAAILTTQGKYPEGKKVFASNLRLTSSLRGLSLFLNLCSLNGSLGQSAAILERSVTERASLEEQAFAWTALAEMAVRSGDERAAEEHFRRSLSLEPNSSYTLAAYSDLLLTQGRQSEVLQLIAEVPVSEALMTRRLLAQGRYDDSFAAQLQSSGHLRELALLELADSSHRELALDTALANWENQKEPIDAIVLLRSLQVTNQREKAKGLTEWLRTAKLEDQRLTKLLSELRVQVAAQ